LVVRDWLVVIKRLVQRGDLALFLRSSYLELRAGLRQNLLILIGLLNSWVYTLFDSFRLPQVFKLRLKRRPKQIVYPFLMPIPLISRSSLLPHSSHLFRC
jgi:hypothetical protein